MKLRQLHYFVTIAETGSFSEASKMCFLSQSAISQQIKALENELNVSLFIRASRMIVLTEAGRELLPHAKKMVQEAFECREIMSDYNKSLNGTLKIGVGCFSEPYVRKATAIMLKKFPSIQIELISAQACVLNKKLVNQEIDVAFTANTAYEKEDIESVPCIKMNLRAIMGRTHPLAHKNKLNMEDIGKCHVIMLDGGERFYASIQKYVKVDLSKLNVRAVMNSASTAIDVVKDTNLITLLPELYTVNRDDILAKPIECLEMPIYVSSHYYKFSPHRRCVNEFVNILKNECYSCLDVLV